MNPIVLRVLVNAVALWAAVRLVPDVEFPAAMAFPAGEWWKLLVVAAIFGVVNAYIKPIAKAVSLPARMMTLGLFTVVVNAAMLLVLALIADAFSLGFRLAHFPPTLDLRAAIAAVLGSIVISVVSMVVGNLVPDRPSWRSRLRL